MYENPVSPGAGGVAGSGGSGGESGNFVNDSILGTITGTITYGNGQSLGTGVIGANGTAGAAGVAA